MASLVLGTAGAIIGGFFGPVGASIGFAVGSALGNLLDPPKIEGPRRTDLKIQQSTYGAPIPYFYGTVRAAGNVIDQSSELTEHKHTSGGKGGPKETTYTYSIGYIAIQLCQAPTFGVPAIKGIRRVWADARLISEDGQPTDDFQFTLYTGTETQEVDPTLEAEHGVGNVPAYLGQAYVVIRDWGLTDFGDRVPSLEWEIEATGDASLERISTFYPTEGGNDFGITSIPVDGATLDGSEVVVYHYAATNPIIAGGTYQEKRYSLTTGALVYTGPEINWPSVNDSSLWDIIPSTNSSIAAGKQRGAGNGPNVTRWYVAGVRTANRIDPPTGANEYYSVASRPYLFDGFVYAPGGGSTAGTAYIGKWQQVDSETIAQTPEAEYYDISAGSIAAGGASIAPAHAAITVGDDGYIYCVYGTTHGAQSYAHLVQVDPSDMSEVKLWAVGPSQSAVRDSLIHFTNQGSFTVYRGTIALNDQSAIPATLGLWNIPDVVTDPFTQVTGAAESNESYFSGISPFIPLGGGYMLGYDGVFLISIGEILGNIVASISGLAGLDASQYDVTDLTDPVPGFRIASQMTARNAIEPLRLGYFFDGAEVDDYILFKHRNGSSVAEIDESDLAAHESGSEPPATITVTRIPDHELPRRVFVRYINPDQSYETGTQYDERLTGESQTDSTVDLPIVLDDDSAKSIASTHLFVALLERERFTIATTRKWEKLVPTDVIEVLGRTLRIVDKRSKASGIIEFDLLTSSALPFIQPSGTSSASVYVPPTAPGERAPTQAEYLDIPNLYQTDPPFGFRVALAPNGPGAWTGAALYKSYDNTNYVEVASTGSPDVIGYTSAVGSPAASAVAAVGVTLGVVLTTPDGELESYTASDLTGGLGLFAVQRSDTFWNLFQYQTATLISADPPTYELSGIIESPLNDRSISGHAADDAFVLLPAVTVDAPESDLNIPIYYKAVTFGRSLSETPYTIFTNTGVATETYYQTTANHLPTFLCDFGSPIGSPAVGRAGMVPAPTLDDCNNERILSVHGWIDNTGGGGGSPSAGGSITVKDEGVTLTTAATSIDFVGDDITATNVGGAVTVTVYSTITTLSRGSIVDLTASALNFNAPLSCADAGSDVTNVSISDFEGADTGSPSPHIGAAGAVPAPASGDGVARKFLMADGTWAVPYSYKVTTPAYAATITVDGTGLSMYGHIQVDVAALTGSPTLNLTNFTNGQIIRVRIEQGGSGGYSVTKGADIAVSTDLPWPVTWSSAVGKSDELGFKWDGTTSKARLVALVRGF